MGNKAKYWPVFILGCPRSGTTLLRLMLTSHSKICIPPESNFIMDLFPEWNNAAFHNKYQIDCALKALYDNDKFPEWDIPRNLIKNRLLSRLPFDFAGFVNQIYLCYMEKLGKSGVWGDKNPGYIHHLDKIIQLFPNAKIIHMVRDGRAVFSSGLKANKIKSDLGLPPKFSGDAFSSYLSWKTALDSAKNKSGLPNFYEIKYENLLDRPSAVLGKVCTFLNVQFEKQMLAYSLQNKEHNLVPKHRIYWHMNTLRSLDSERANAWQKELPRKDILHYELIAKHKLEEYGYKAKISIGHLCGLDFRFIVKFTKFILRELQGSLPIWLQKLLRSTYSEYRYTRGVRIRKQIRRIRETWAAFRPVTFGPGSQGSQVVYMTGMPRTGSSLTKNYLGDHPELGVMPFQPGGFVYAWEKSEQNGSIVVDKATHYIRSIHKIYRAYGNHVAFYCIIRDPRDELVSLIETTKHREIHRDKRFWPQWYENYNGYLNFAMLQADKPLKCYLIRYEDLVRWPIQAKVSFLSWLGLDVNPNKITAEYRILHENDIQDGKVEERTTITTHSVGRWKALNDPKIHTLLRHWQGISHIQILMQSLGYIEHGFVDRPLNFAGLTVFQPCVLQEGL